MDTLGSMPGLRDESEKPELGDCGFGGELRNESRCIYVIGIHACAHPP